MSTTNRRRRPRTAALLASVLVLTTVVALPGAATTTSNFEGADGNLTPSTGIDWNSFAGDAALIGQWGFTRIDDDTGNKDDSIFVQNTKDHRFECPNVGSGSMGGGGNKDDLKRLYLATQTFDDGVYLYLAWTRVDQNSTSASANLSFEFNQSKVNCNEGGRRTNQLVYRTDGDLLVLYDFYGGDGRVEIFLSEWTDTGPCEVGNHTAPCWGPVANLTAGNAAVGAVNTAGPVYDEIADETLGTVAFGEAAINLTTAGVFDADAPSCKPFGSAHGISRSSGNSISSSLSDLIGPASFELSNCGSLTIAKETDPEGSNEEFTFTTTGIPTSEGGYGGTFDLKDGESRTFNDLFAGSYTVTEPDPGAGFELSDVACTGIDEDDWDRVYDEDDGTKLLGVDVDLSADQNVTCTFTNTQRHSLVVEKTGVDGALAGAAFELFTAVEDGNDLPELVAGESVGALVLLNFLVDDKPGDANLFCIDDLTPGTYVLSETTVPDGYEAVDDVVVTTSQGGTCNDRYDALTGDVVGAVDETITNSPAPRTVTVEKELADTGDPLPGFTFALYDGENVNPEDDPAPTPLATGTTSDGVDLEGPALGTVVFTGIPVGDYTLCEIGSPDPAAYWLPQLPDCRNIEVELNEDLLETFTNDPLSKVEVIFYNMTGYTSATIACADALNVELGADSSTTADDDLTVTLDHLPAGDYDCTITIIDGDPPTPPVDD